MFKAIGKFFKKAGRAIKKVWPMALLATAIFFTAGAALGGLGGMGWGKAVATFVGKIGVKGTLGKVLSGTIAGAGYGSMIGGGISAATGGSFLEGARSGAISGAITGGIAGAAGWQPGGKPGVDELTEPPLGTRSSGSGATSATRSNSLIGYLKGAGKWAEKNPVLAGGLISGVGKGIAGAAAAQSRSGQAEAERQAVDDRLEQIAANYRVSREALGLPPLEQPAAGAAPTPVQAGTPSLVQTAVPDVAARLAVDPLRVSQLNPNTEELRRRADPNSLLAYGLGVGA